MSNNSGTKDDGQLVRLHDYFKYLYEEEKHRTEHLNSATNTYLVFITFAFTFTVGLFNWLYPQVDAMFFGKITIIQSILLAGLIISIVLIIVSLVFTILVVKVRRFERLCIPKEFAKEASGMVGENEIINSITSHFIVAVEKNYQVNNAKAKFLAYGLRTYIFGFLLLLISISLLNILGR
jgi:hypothetical protein